MGSVDLDDSVHHSSSSSVVVVVVKLKLLLSFKVFHIYVLITVSTV